VLAPAKARRLLDAIYLDGIADGLALVARNRPVVTAELGRAAERNRKVS
jgi:hypothetical protein